MPDGEAGDSWTVLHLAPTFRTESDSLDFLTLFRENLADVRSVQVSIGKLATLLQLGKRVYAFRFHVNGELVCEVEVVP